MKINYASLWVLCVIPFLLGILGPSISMALGYGFWIGFLIAAVIAVGIGRYWQQPLYTKED